MSDTQALFNHPEAVVEGWYWLCRSKDVRRGKVKLLYVAPERLLTQRILSLLTGIKVDLLTIDEAHCISEWGHDFRPEYRQLVEVRKRFPQAVCLALTATATTRVRQDIRTTLKFFMTNEFVASFNRENLFIEVLHKREPVAQTVQLLERYKDQSGIIYCFSRKQVDELADQLEDAFRLHSTPPVEKKDVRLWVLACERLLARGRTTCFDYSVRHLRHAVPNSRSLKTLAGILGEEPIEE